MKSVLITGAGGLLGKSLCLHLSQTEMSVIGLVHSDFNDEVGGVEYCSIDFSSDWSINSLPTKIDIVIHLAQSTNFRNFPNSALDVFKVNIDSTARLLDYAKRIGAEKFIYASSGGVYGGSTQAFNESAPIAPFGRLGYYLGSKVCSEIMVQSYASIFQVVVLRPFFMYGQGQKRGMLIPRLFDSVAAGKPVSLQGDDGIRINPIHVDDASATITAALALEEGATFNIAGPNVISIREICEGMGRYLGIVPVFEQQSGEPNDLIADISAMRDRLYSPKRSLLDCFDSIRP